MSQQTELPTVQPLVSVVMPAYNMASYIEEALVSVLKSDYPSLEVIVVDDGSVDDTYAIVNRIAANDKRVRVYKQPNAGACAARNLAIQYARGEYILPVDADNLIEPQFVSLAAQVLTQHPEVKVVAPRADFFGDRTGEWKLPPFSLSLLARKNIMDTCAMYRRDDWVRVGGYCVEIIAREDWEFWISVLKDGGEVVRLDKILLHYRIRNASKRVSDRQLKQHVVRVLNARHPEFFERMLGGPLRQHRSWSRIINRCQRIVTKRSVGMAFGMHHWRHYISALPEIFDSEKGLIIHKGRNELRILDWQGEPVVVKSFAKPNLINRFVYGTWRKSKAQRSMEYAQMLLEHGIGSPTPIGYCNCRFLGIFGKSYYVSRLSKCSHSYADYVNGTINLSNNVLRRIAQVAARMHELGWVHRDFSRGNILFEEHEDGTVDMEIIDLNRIRFHKIDVYEGCRNFERLPATPEMLKMIAKEYAKLRGFDADLCYSLMTKYREGASNKD